MNENNLCSSNMSWSENRTVDTSNRIKWEEKRKRFEAINAVLHKIASDEDFYDDLKLPIVLKAIDHWTGKHRLPPDEAAQLQEHRRVVYVLQRIQMLQHVSQEAGIPTPLHLLLEKKLLNIDEYRPSGQPIEEKGRSRKNGNKSAPVQESKGVPSSSQNDAVEKKALLKDQDAAAKIHSIANSPESNESAFSNSSARTELKKQSAVPLTWINYLQQNSNLTLLFGLFFLALFWILSYCVREYA